MEKRRWWRKRWKTIFRMHSLHRSSNTHEKCVIKYLWCNISPWLQPLPRTIYIMYNREWEKKTQIEQLFRTTKMAQWLHFFATQNVASGETGESHEDGFAVLLMHWITSLFCKRREGRGNKVCNKNIVNGRHHLATLFRLFAALSCGWALRNRLWWSTSRSALGIMIIVTMRSREEHFCSRKHFHKLIQSFLSLLAEG